jgi:23S rRNA (cytosine1962-C5)-methyltransferase
MQSNISITKAEKGFELIDSGEGEKLERWGDFVLSRPDPQALWRKSLPEKDWLSADGIFSREETDSEWRLRSDVPQSWEIDFGGLRFRIRPSPFKHTGLFPEQLENWKWMADAVKNAGRPVSVLNLFGYTGGASLALAKAGAEVCHVDASKKAVDWARENADLSGLEDKPIRWIVDDAVAFVKREIRRGRKYDAIVMDPPAFGHGPKKELWKIEDSFLEMIDLCGELLSDDPVFFVINGYSAGYSAIAYQNALASILPENSKIEIGELTLEEESGRLLPCGIFARWKN